MNLDRDSGDKQHATIRVVVI